jgi:hypothetical protein
MRVIILLLLLSGCYSAKKAERQMNKAQINFPEVVATKSALWYPCIPIRTTSDSNQYKSWFDTINVLNDLRIDTIYQTDTIQLLKYNQRLVYKYRNIYKTLPVIHDTIVKQSMAEQTIIQQLIADREKAHKKYDNSTKLNIWLLIALLISIFAHFFRNVIK